MKYYLKLDAIRAIAVLLVIFSHWFPIDHWVNSLPNGTLGVHIFFVLSGFLISEILFKQKESNADRWFVLKQFYIRRTLRIFPIYYLTLFTLFIFPRTPQFFKDDIGWFAAYAGNIYFYITEKFGFAAHLWTLACEEQFYLIWPFLVLFTPRRWMPFVLGTTIIFGKVSVGIWPSESEHYILMMHCMESFGIGALLAYVKLSHIQLFNRMKYPAVFVTVLTFSAICYTSITSISVNQHIFRSLITSTGAGLIYFGIMQQKQWLERVFTNSALTYIGKISYGMYLYHAFFPWLHKKITFRFIPSLQVLEQQHYVYFIFNFLLLLIVCHFSWVLIEKPINKLKDKFEYRKN